MITLTFKNDKAMTEVTSRAASSNASIEGRIDNAQGQKINVSVNWNWSVSAPDTINVSGWYNTSEGFSASFNRQYDSDGTYPDDGSSACTGFDSTFNDALKALVLECFGKYNDVSRIGVEE